MLDGNLAGLGVFLLVFACIASAIMVARGDSDTRRLESRIRSLHGVAVAPSGAGAKQPPRSIKRAATGSPLVRALEKVGRSRHIPEARRIAWPIVAGAGLGAAFGAGYFGNKVVGAAFAPAFALVGRSSSSARYSGGKAAATRGSSSSSSPTP
jgi:hypothetical protein